MRGWTRTNAIRSALGVALALSITHPALGQFGQAEPGPYDDCQRQLSPKSADSLRRDRDKAIAVKAEHAAKIAEAKRAVAAEEATERRLSFQRDHARAAIRDWRALVADAKTKEDIDELSARLERFKAELNDTELALANVKLRLNELKQDLKTAEDEQALNDATIARVDAALKGSGDCPRKTPKKVSTKKTQGPAKPFFPGPRPKPVCAKGGGLAGAVQDVACQDAG